jgi:hypothetical protein
MNVELKEGQSENLAAIHMSRRILFYTAAFATLLGMLYLLGLAGKLIVDGTVHSTSSKAVQNLSAAVAILWDLSLLVLFVALRRQILGSRAIFAELALIFMAIVCTVSSINWFVQLLVVSRITRVGESVLLALLDVNNGLSLMYAMEHLAWGVFYGLAAIFAAVAIGSGRLESWIRWLFVAGGILSLLHVIGMLTATSVVSDLGYVAWGILLPITTALLALRFRLKQK